MNTTIKRFLNLTWKVGLGLIGLAALVIGILVAGVWYEEKYGRDYWDDFTLSENVKVEAYVNNTVRGWNKKTARLTTTEMVSKDLIKAELDYGDEGIIMDRRGNIVKQ